MATPVFGADSRFDADTVTSVPAEDTSFPKSNLSDDRVFTVFKPTSAATTVDVITDTGGAGASVDYFGLIGHDLFDPASDGNGAVLATFASSPDNSVYTTIFSVTPTDNKVIFRTFASVSERFFRLRMTRGASFIPSLGQLQWGVRVEIPFGVQVPFDPEEERINARSTKSQTGNIMGTTLVFSERRARLRFPLQTDTFLRSATTGQFGDFWNNHASLMKAFFFAWNPGNPGSFEQDAFFAIIDPRSNIRRPLTTQVDTGFRDLQIEIQGLKET